MLEPDLSESINSSYKTSKNQAFHHPSNSYSKLLSTQPDIEKLMKKTQELMISPLRGIHGLQRNQTLKVKTFSVQHHEKIKTAKTLKNFSD